MRYSDHKEGKKKKLRVNGKNYKVQNRRILHTVYVWELSVARLALVVIIPDCRPISKYPVAWPSPMIV